MNALENLSEVGKKNRKRCPFCRHMDCMDAEDSAAGPAPPIDFWIYDLFSDLQNCLTRRREEEERRRRRMRTDSSDKTSKASKTSTGRASKLEN